MWFVIQYGKQLYLNYQEAMRRTEAAHDWSSLSSSSIKSGSSSSSLPGEFSSAAADISESQMRQCLIFNRRVYCCLFTCSLDFVILSCLQNLSPTTPANQTAACQRPHHLVMCALRVSSAPSSLRHGREAIRQMNPRWTLKSFTSLFTCSALFHLCFFIMVSLSSLLCLNPFLKTFCLQYY